MQIAHHRVVIILYGCMALGIILATVMYGLDGDCHGTYAAAGAGGTAMAVCAAAISYVLGRVMWHAAIKDSDQSALHGERAAGWLLAGPVAVALTIGVTVVLPVVSYFAVSDRIVGTYVRIGPRADLWWFIGWSFLACAAMQYLVGWVAHHHPTALTWAAAPLNLNIMYTKLRGRRLLVVCGVVAAVCFIVGGMEYWKDRDVSTVQKTVVVQEK